MSDERVVFETIRPWLDAQGFNAPGRVAALNAALLEYRRRAAATVPAPRPSQGLGRRVSPAAIALLHGFETFQAKAYPDPGSRDGKPVTCGWGSTTDLAGAPIRLGAVWTREYADAVFARDLAKFEDGVTRLLGGSPTTQGQFDALVCLAYNIGLDEDTDTIAEGLGDSSLLKKHKVGNYAGAAAAFNSWRFNDGREMKGLIRRRKAERALYEGAA